MTPPKKNPTNADLFRQNGELSRQLNGMNNRVLALEEWKRGLDIAKQAVTEYKNDEQQRRDANQKREVIKQVGIVLALIAAVLYVYLEAHGIHP